jgi:hypothetical protein
MEDMAQCETYAVYLILLVLVNPESGIDTADTPSSVPIDCLWRMSGHERDDLGIEMLEKRGISQPHKIARQDLHVSRVPRISAEKTHRRL